MINRWSLLFFLALLSPIIGIFFGAADLSPSQLYQCVVAECASQVDSVIFWEIRLPRVLVGFLVGAGLAVAGATLQNITRNGLADPYLFGVVSGAGLGASIATLLFDSQMGETLTLFRLLPDVSFSLALPVAAFLGAVFAVTLVQALASSSFGGRGEHMLLAGVAVSFMLSAFSHFLLFLGDPFAANKVIFWLMGSLARVEMWYAWIMLPIVMGSVLLLLLFGRRLDALLLGDENAKTLGVNVTAIRLLALGICAALTACIVAYCGGIGFVGLLIPHIVRRWVGVTSRALILGCVLVGGSFMVLVDILARSALAEQEIPIGIITSAIGSVFFLLAIRQRQT
ncbi:iron ABC transporter permease [Paraglaciecola sp. L1A13]|uniref:FecCD family ABC transporter permease n=1 Tax=Paraglaciecola sp. L1A13 TaxID=2686359 RepID=UPI00131C452D|nr:iron ABC transporter permease [Paraglaciecola sp. L1A13]|tara:strand:+ start:1858 stop:2880 length:1023 start_codon:yes stop_codon:yes gene_type:complete